MNITTETKSCTAFGYMPLVQPYVARIYPVTVSAVTLTNGSRALKVSDDGGRSKNAQRAAEHGINVAGILITREHASRYKLNSKLDGGEYFDKVFGMLENAG